MKFRIKRHDGIEDEVTVREFETYEQAYDLLESIYADICCSDSDYEDRPYYDIFDSNEYDLLESKA